MKRLSNLRVGILQIPLTRIVLLILADCMSVFMASVLGLYVRYDFSICRCSQGVLGVCFAADHSKHFDFVCSILYF